MALSSSGAFSPAAKAPATVHRSSLYRGEPTKRSGRRGESCWSWAGTQTLRPILDPFNETGSSRFVGFSTTKTNFFTPRADRCHVNLVVCDGDWEAACAQSLEAMPELLRYVKNDRLGFEVPYTHAGAEHINRPDFIAVLDDGHGLENPLHFGKPPVGAVCERGRAVRALGFLRVDGPYDVPATIRRHLAGLPAAPAVFALTQAL